MERFTSDSIFIVTVLLIALIFGVFIGVISKFKITSKKIIIPFPSLSNKEDLEEKHIYKEEEEEEDNYDGTGSELTRIKGIGKGTADKLNIEGIITFKDLAESNYHTQLKKWRHNNSIIWPYYASLFLEDNNQTIESLNDFLKNKNETHKKYTKLKKKLNMSK